MTMGIPDARLGRILTISRRRNHLFSGFPYSQSIDIRLDWADRVSWESEMIQLTVKIELN